MFYMITKSVFLLWGIPIDENTVAKIYCFTKKNNQDL